MTFKNNAITMLITSTLLIGCQQKIQQIDNPNFNKKGDIYTQLYPSHYTGKGPHHPYDELDFRTDEEKKPMEASFISFAYSGIDKTHGYDFSKLVSTSIKVEPENNGHITWLGHASFLIQQTNGDAFVTDPVFGEFDGFGWIGSQIDPSLKRLGEAPIKASELPFVDGIVISHNHYDHLNSETLNNFADNTHLFLPLDNADDVNYKKGPITEMDWFTQTQLKQTTVNLVPANHLSAHGIASLNKSLWGGWILQDNQYQVYFAGDTGYSSIFKDIHAKFGDIDVCLMPIVAYPGPARKNHLSPEDAIKAAQDLNCKVFIPWGYGTWSLGYEHVNEPVRRLTKAVEDIKPNFKVYTLKMGEKIDYASILSSSTKN
jgi:N-acyl-phosphatidylethanolamine-hydrolysing phospholipase D